MVCSVPVHPILTFLPCLNVGSVFQFVLVLATTNQPPKVAAVT